MFLNMLLKSHSVFLQYSLPNRSENSFGGGTASLDCYSLSSVSAESQKLLRTLRGSKRKISPDAFKVL
jgi:hypothetical protein